METRVEEAFRHKQRNPMDIWHSSANKCACEYLRSCYPVVGTTANEADVLGIGHIYQRAAKSLWGKMLNQNTFL